MEFAFGLLFASLCFFFGVRLFERRPIPAPIDSARIGRLHYFLLGGLIGIVLPGQGDLFRIFEPLRHSLMGIALVWFGFQTGLNFDLRRLQKCPSRRLLSEAVQVFAACLMVFLGVLAAQPLLKSYLGVKENTALAALLLAILVTTVRTSDPILHRGKRIFPLSTEAAFHPHAFHNSSALMLFGVAFPIVGGSGILRFSPFTFVGYTSTLALLMGLGFLMGIVLDFIFRAHRDGLRCTYLTSGVIAAIGGLCLQFQIPGIFIGFLGGAWLINATVRRREVLELTERAGSVVGPVFFLFLGSALSGYSGESSFRVPAVLLVPVALLLARTISRTLGSLAAQRISEQKQTWQEALRTGWLPLGGVSAALAVQGLYLPLQLAHNTLIAGALLSIFLSQTLILPASERDVSAPSSPGPNQAVLRE